MRDAHEQRHQDVVREQGRPAVADEGQRHPGEGEQAHDAGHDEKGLETEDGGEADGGQLRELRAGADRRPYPGAYEQKEADDDRGRTEQAELLADGREDEVAVRDGDVVGTAEAEARSRETAPGEGELSLDRLVAVGTVMRPGVD